MGIDYKKLGQRLKKRRRELGMTQERLAEYCDISSTYVSHIETGIAKVSLDVLYRISVILQVTPDYFLIDTTKALAYVRGELSDLLDKCDPQTLYTAEKLIEALIEIQKDNQE